MRIISGKYKGYRFSPPRNLPYRPTTDIAKSGLFNILNNYWNFDNIKFLDLFSGTGSITYEFASRGCTDICSVDLNFGCIKYLKETAKKLDAKGIRAHKADVFKFINSCDEDFDLIFAGPPYPLPNIPDISDIIFKRKLIREHGWLIVETNHLTKLDEKDFFNFKRNYGTTIFNFFSWKKGEI
jgi:16S rRNA (guanine(966)-N(2))-methyltransferase RsmD